MDKITKRNYMREYYTRPGQAQKCIARNQKRREILKLWFKERKETLICSKCPENDPRCLDFHHINPTTKTTPRGGISQAIFNGWSIQRLETEISKCGVICANCHRLEHTTDSPKNKGVMQRGKVPPESELILMTRARRHYWKHQDQRIAKKNQRTIQLFKWYQELKTATRCLQCSESQYQCLDYHHRDQNCKINTISKLIQKGWSKEKLLIEIAKCDLLCANCHRKLHLIQRQS